MVFGRGFSPRSPEPGGDFEIPPGHAVLPEGIFKIPERAMGIWGKSTTINQNFVHIFFLNPGDIKTILYISNYFASLYGQAYFTKKIYIDSQCLAGVFIIKFTVTKTLFLFLSFIKKFYKNFPFCLLLYLLHLFVSYFIYSSELIRGLLKNPGSTRGFGNPRPGDL